MSKKTEKTSVEKLTEELLINRKNGFMDVTDEQVKKADKFCEGYKTFLNKAKTEREAVFETIAYAEKMDLYLLTETLLTKRAIKYIIIIVINP